MRSTQAANCAARASGEPSRHWLNVSNRASANAEPDMSATAPPRNVLRLTRKDMAVFPRNPITEDRGRSCCTMDGSGARPDALPDDGDTGRPTAESDSLVAIVNVKVDPV